MAALPLQWTVGWAACRSRLIVGRMLERHMSVYRKRYTGRVN